MMRVLWQGSCGAVYMYSFYRLNCLVIGSEMAPIPEMDPEGLVIGQNSVTSDTKAASVAAFAV
jgi:hypothetical protein